MIIIAKYQISSSIHLKNYAIVCLVENPHFPSLYEKIGIFLRKRFRNNLLLLCYMYHIIESEDSGFMNIITKTLQPSTLTIKEEPK